MLRRIIKPGLVRADAFALRIEAVATLIAQPDTKSLDQLLVLVAEPNSCVVEPASVFDRI